MSTNWQILRDSAIAFGRGDRGFVAINVGDTPLRSTVFTRLPAGSYCNVIIGCEGGPYEIDTDGSMQLSLPPMSALALHTGAPAER